MHAQTPADSKMEGDSQPVTTIRLGRQTKRERNRGTDRQAGIPTLAMLIGCMIGQVPFFMAACCCSKHARPA